MNRSQPWNEGRKKSQFWFQGALWGEQCTQAQGTTLGGTWVPVWDTATSLIKVKYPKASRSENWQFQGYYSLYLITWIAQKFFVSLYTSCFDYFPVVFLFCCLWVFQQALHSQANHQSLSFWHPKFLSLPAFWLLSGQLISTAFLLALIRN